MAWTQAPLERSYSCNKDLLLYQRKRLGWTQGQLAAKAGYSERLISKAESGKPISVDTIGVLVETLSTAQETVYPEDLICDVLSLTKEFIAAFYTHQKNFVSATRHFLDEEIVFVFVGDPEAIPFSGTYCGIDEMQQFMEVFYSVVEAPAGHDYGPWYRYFFHGNDVMVLGETWLHPIGAPLDKPISLSAQFTFRKGKLLLFRNVYDTHHAAKTLHDSTLHDSTLHDSLSEPEQ